VTVVVVVVVVVMMVVIMVVVVVAVMVVVVVVGGDGGGDGHYFLRWCDSSSQLIQFFLPFDSSHTLQGRPEVWLEGEGECPTCRSTFNVSDLSRAVVAPLSHEESRTM
jgi:hypothetical protein